MSLLPAVRRLLVLQPGVAGACRGRGCGLVVCSCRDHERGSARALNTQQGAGPRPPAVAKSDFPPAGSAPAGGGDKQLASRPVGPQDYSIAMKMAQKLASVPHGTPLAPGEAGRLSGLPRHELNPGRVLIFSNSKNPEQQGRQKSAFNKSFPHWSIEYLDPASKWINPLMGWTSTADTKHQAAVNMQFHTAEEAAAFCERQGWEYEIQEPNAPRDTRSRRYAAYGDDFSIKRHGIPDLSHLPSENAAAVERSAQRESGGSHKAAGSQGRKPSLDGV
ncbi:hypothetical protein HXX76_006867 [Chlamydomonas incerta]|uniref:NADH dehydrogenase [ubiquinone] iron-sulfur protein 4, mitochondrial n=1 Tax=Chlamydomonas incerta TaxID=51695 RepID=A0A835TCY0_CHLIN|nr:hypothetical protein HXX76_006867 [Chlamydomonas incerta]|eukprot:KAG2435665.1 hypothetical protein HXX76_006867 [Chlamydomonas incerta]